MLLLLCKCLRSNGWVNQLNDAIFIVLSTETINSLRKKMKQPHKGTNVNNNTLASFPKKEGIRRTTSHAWHWSCEASSFLSHSSENTNVLTAALGCPGVETGGIMGRGYEGAAVACGGRGAAGVAEGAGAGLESGILPICFNWTSLRASLEIGESDN